MLRDLGADHHSHDGDEPQVRYSADLDDELARCLLCLAGLQAQGLAKGNEMVDQEGIRGEKVQFVVVRYRSSFI